VFLMVQGIPSTSFRLHTTTGAFQVVNDPHSEAGLAIRSVSGLLSLLEQAARIGSLARMLEQFGNYFSVDPHHGGGVVRQVSRDLTSENLDCVL